MTFGSPLEMGCEGGVNGMLDVTKEYYVSVGNYPKNVIESWANENGMMLTGDEVKLPTCGKAYGIDVRHNADLRKAMKIQGSGWPNFLNGKRVIGGASSDNARGKECVVVWPAIRDR